MDFDKVLRLLESKHPEKFKSPDEFQDYVYSTFRHKDTYVERQGGSDWYAEIHGDEKIKSATYDAKSKIVLWFDENDNEI